METYHKIQTLFKRHLDGPKKGKMIMGAWTTPTLKYLANNRWEFTEKVDGTNIRIGYSRDKAMHNAGSGSSSMMEFGGRTDNAVIPEPLHNYLVETFTREKFWEAFPDFDGTVVLYGEGYGPKIQGGGKYRDDHSFVLFDVKIGNFWLTRPNVDDIASKLGIDSVPTIGYGTLEDAIDIVSSGIIFNDKGGIVRYGRGGLQSTWGEFLAEGIVARPVVPLFDNQGNRIITKIKKVDFQ